MTGRFITALPVIIKGFEHHYGPILAAMLEKGAMNPQQQLSMMDKIIRELDDLKNSQTAVLKKIAQIEADNINLDSGLLNEGLPGIHEEVDDAVQKVGELVEKFREERNKYEQEHPVTTE